MKKKVLQFIAVATLVVAAFLIGKATTEIPEGYIKLDECIPLEDIACYSYKDGYPCFELKDVGNQLDDPHNRSYEDIMNVVGRE